MAPIGRFGLDRFAAREKISGAAWGCRSLVIYTLNSATLNVSYP